jgi:hypothetical protein
MINQELRWVVSAKPAETKKSHASVPLIGVMCFCKFIHFITYAKMYQCLFIIMTLI